MASLVYERENCDVEMAKQMLLSVNEVEMWSKHISNVATARKLGAKKAAATRREKGNLKVDGFSSINYTGGVINFLNCST